MARQSDRFVKIYSQGSFTTLQIWGDRETGVNYLWQSSGYGGGRKHQKKPQRPPHKTQQKAPNNQKTKKNQPKKSR